MSESDEPTLVIRSGRRGPQPLAKDASTLLRHHLGTRGFARVELVTRWAEIVGAGLAEHCFPYRLSAGGSGGATLTLLADDRAALELQHQGPKLIDKINAYFGTAVISKIKVVAGDIPKPLAKRAAPRALRPDEEAALHSRVSGIQDPTLRAAFERLGRHALGESRKPAVYKR
jgi:hypothetical protein